jgi:hypothetical protein
MINLYRGGVLSDNYQNQSQINTVFPEQEKVDRVGVEPTTSAHCLCRYTADKKSFKKRDAPKHNFS